MAEVFNLNPSEFINMNDLFPVLNDKVGLTYEQWRKAIENINYVYQHLGVSDVYGGNVQIITTAVGTEAQVEITPRKVVVDGKSIVYLDFIFYTPKSDEFVSKVTEQTYATSSGTGIAQVALSSVAGQTVKDNVFQINFLREYLPHLMANNTVKITATGFEFTDNINGNQIKPTINGEEVAYMSDLTAAIQSAISDSWEAEY